MTERDDVRTVEYADVFLRAKDWLLIAVTTGDITPEEAKARMAVLVRAYQRTEPLPDVTKPIIAASASAAHVALDAFLASGDDDDAEFIVGLLKRLTR